MSLKLLKSQTLTLKVIDADGTPQSRTITEPTFDQAGEFILPAQLPLGLHELSVSLSGQLKSLTRGEEQTLSAKTSTLYRNRDLASRNVGDIIFVPGGHLLD